MRIFTAYTSSGDIIEEFNNVAEAIMAINRYEAEDKLRGRYVPNSYCIVDDNKIILR